MSPDVQRSLFDKALHGAFVTAKRLPPVAAVADAPGLARARRAFRERKVVKESWRYLAAESARRRGIHAYTLRGSGSAIHLRHQGRHWAGADTDCDSWVLSEVFVDEGYALPRTVEAALADLDEPRFVDLGVHIGLFSVWFMQRFDGAVGVGYEPDPANRAVAQRTLAPAIADGRYVLQAAAAGNAAGRASCGAGLGSGSSLLSAAQGPTLEVAVSDVLPDLAIADFAKIDIEGGEWAILGDDRLATTALRALNLEFHPAGCPSADPADFAAACLQAAGFSLADPPRPFDLSLAPAGQGILWAVRD